MIVANTESNVPSGKSAKTAETGPLSSRRRPESSGETQRSWLAAQLVALLKNLYYLQFSLGHGLARALWRGCSFGRLQTRAPLCWDIACPPIHKPDELLSWLRQQGLRVIDAEHALYIPPQDALQVVFFEIANFYPPNCGFKILKDLRPPVEANYLAGRPGSVAVRRRLTGSPAEHVVTANYMHVLGIGPRLWDLCTWQGESTALTVFVVQHVEGETPTADECHHFLDRLRTIIQETDLRILMPRWERQDDFECPTCRGNLISATDDSGPQYVDFQNFRLRDPASWSADVLTQVTDAAESNVRLPSGLPDHPFAALSQLDIDVHGRIVMYHGWGVGEVLGTAIARGAIWGVGWTVPHGRDLAESFLFSQGVGRFTLIDSDATMPPKFDDTRVASGVRDRLDQAILICQMDTDNVGELVRSIRSLPWQHLVCCSMAGRIQRDEIVDHLGSVNVVEPTASTLELSDAAGPTEAITVLSRCRH